MHGHGPVWAGSRRSLRVSVRVFGHSVMRAAANCSTYRMVPLPDPETPAPPRFLPVYDNLMLSHADRTRIVRAGDRSRTGYMAGPNVGSVLIDGVVGATWSLKRGPGAATLQIGLFDRLPRRERVAVEDEGARLLTFIAAEATAREVMVLRPSAQGRTIR